MNRPFIVMTARNQSEKKDNPSFSNNQSYSDYVRIGGGIPSTVTAFSQEEADQIAEMADGLLITGGEDCIPASYHEENNGSFPIEEKIENSDFLLYRAFRRKNRPVLGICRGIQVIGVCEGVSLIQDIPTVFHTEHTQSHCNPPLEKEAYCHRVFFEEGTLLHDIFGDSHMVNSFHHQALASVPEGFSLAAESEEGIIEAIEKVHVLAVQWHPERLTHDPRHVAIIQKWIQECLSSR